MTYREALSASSQRRMAVVMEIEICYVRDLWKVSMIYRNLRKEIIIFALQSAEVTSLQFNFLD